jgi:hypothetical protein
MKKYITALRKPHQSTILKCIVEDILLKYVYNYLHENNDMFA